MAERKSDLGARSARLVPLVLQKDEEEVEAEAKPRGAAHTAVNTTSLKLPALTIFHSLKNFKQFIYMFFLYRDHIALQLGMFLTNKIT
ncbi:hypothetical protein ALC57_10166 [Trachymyrmex cornetzi]|uniref:Uncharacterized protein n=1 Tax=Trachymyrmex cornetzi TaxID=471704 RepID=A0A151J4I4_9HYME|nr:hypothetical protein ALC57_10166 [Trachymyrmex cornetzi]